MVQNLKKNFSEQGNETPPEVKEKIIEEIQELKKSKNASVFAYNFQRPEIHEIADVMGDSFELTEKIMQNESEMVVFCSVMFMVETVKILNPNKRIFIPVKNSRCAMARTITVDKLKEFKSKYPDHKVVTYVNSTAEIKALSDVCVTSTNAVKVVENYPHDKLLFIPDGNLGNYVKSKVRNKDIVVWNGHCYVHKRIMAENLKNTIDDYPDVEVLVHPECGREVRDLADKIMSTGQMIKYVKQCNKDKFIISTESGILYRMKKENPHKEFISPGMPVICKAMKKTRLIDVLNSLKYDQHEILLSDELICKSQRALNEMLKYNCNPSEVQAAGNLSVVQAGASAI